MVIASLPVESNPCQHIAESVELSVNEAITIEETTHVIERQTHKETRSRVVLYVFRNNR